MAADVARMARRRGSGISGIGCAGMADGAPGETAWLTCKAGAGMGLALEGSGAAGMSGVPFLNGKGTLYRNNYLAPIGILGHTGWRQAGRRRRSSNSGTFEIQVGGLRPGLMPRVLAGLRP